MAKVSDLEDQRPPQHTVTMFGRFSPLWQHLNPFRRRRTTPPPQILSARVIEPSDKELPPTPSPTKPSTNQTRWDLKGRIGAFLSEQGEKLFENGDQKAKDSNIPITVIPAQPRGGRTWSPDALKALSEGSENSLRRPNGSTAVNQDRDQENRRVEEHRSKEDSTDIIESQGRSNTPRLVFEAAPAPHPQIQVHDYATSGSASGPVSPTSPVSFSGPLQSPRNVTGTPHR